MISPDRSQFDEERRQLERDAQNDGKTTIWLSADEILIGLIIIADAIKPGAPSALAALRGLGVTTTLATGDQAATAASVAKVCGVEHVEAKLTPADKARLVTKLQSEGHVVAMAGDGINPHKSQTS